MDSPLLTNVLSATRREPKSNAEKTSDARVTHSWSRDWQYFSVCTAFWCFIPELRRVLDWRSGAFSSVQILSVLPLISVVPLLIWALRKDRLARLSSTLRAFMVAWIIAFGYALVIGFLAGNSAAAFYSFLSFVIPMISGLWIATQQLSPAATLRRLATIIVCLGGIVGVYGIIQFISPPPWDALWVISAHMDSAGLPEPFTMRVFSTINSQGVCAEFLAVALFLGLSTNSLRAYLTWPLLAAIAASLVLTLVRSTWVGLVTGLIAYVILSPRRLKVLPIVAAFACIIAFLVVSLPTLLGDARGGQQIVDRLQTFNDLGHDTSALDRQSEISDAFDSGNRNPLGTGLGLVGPAAKLIASNNEEGHALDSGYLARFSELGYLGFFTYIAVIFGTFATLLIRVLNAGRLETEDRNALAAAAAICFSMLTFELAGDTYFDIIGFFAWIAIGLGFHSSFSVLMSKSMTNARPNRSRIPT